jgi:hypothetical protein
MAQAVSPDLAGDFPEAVLLDSGRGLFIIQRLADALWWTPGRYGGKTVWCRFDIDRGARTGPPPRIPYLRPGCLLRDRERPGGVDTDRT